jgi:hypothetical protein
LDTKEALIIVSLAMSCKPRMSNTCTSVVIKKDNYVMSLEKPRMSVFDKDMLHQDF